MTANYKRSRGKDMHFYMDEKRHRILKEHSQNMCLSMSAVLKIMIDIADPLFRKRFRSDYFENTKSQTKLTS